jgi:hypothetical protein
MKRKILFIVLALLGMLAVTISATLRAPSLLSTKEVKELVAKADSPEIHLKLARHFRAFAALKEAEADEYSVIAEQYHAGTPKVLEDPLLSNRAENCGYLADSLFEAGKAARDLAAEHERLAYRHISSLR